MRTVKQLQTEYEQLDLAPDKTEWMTQQLLEDIQHAPAKIQLPDMLRILEEHTMQMLIHILQVVMAAAPAETVRKATEDFVAFALLDKLSRIHKTLTEDTLKPKLYIPKATV